jgi:prepilin-type N-terminal cleavage/methylation domain-containing protein
VPRTGRWPGFTLVELVVSIGIMSVLAVGVSSAVLVATRAIEQSTSKSACIRQASSVSQELASELSTAVAVSGRNANSISFSVPDRNADGSTEDISYSWSGTAGAALYRRYNSETATAVLDNVYQFQLSYDFVSILFQNLPGGEVLFAEHTSANDLGSFRPGNLICASQSFTATLPKENEKWRITGVALYCRQKGDTGGQVTVQAAYALSDGKPGVVFCQATVPESVMGTSYAWQDFPFSSCSTYLLPTQSVCIVVRGSVADSCEVRYHGKNATASGGYYYQSTNAGVTWSLQSGQSLLFQVYGNATGVSDGTMSETRLSGVRWQLRAGGDSTATIHGGAQTVNLPE